MNDDNQSDAAGITYSENSDLVELWYTRLRPFAERGYWVVVPGFAAMLKGVED